MSYKEIIDNVSNIEDLDNTTILKVLEKFSKTIKDFAIEQSGLNNLVNVEFIPSDNNTTYTGDSVDYLGTLKLTLSDNIIVNKPCNIKFNIKSSNTIVVNVDEFNNSLELHLDNSVVTTLAFAESERQKSATDGGIVHKKEIADVEHIETIYDMSSSDSNINWGNTAGILLYHELNIVHDFSGFKKYDFIYEPNTHSENWYGSARTITVYDAIAADEVFTYFDCVSPSSCYAENLGGIEIYTQFRMASNKQSVTVISSKINSDGSFSTINSGENNFYRLIKIVGYK